MSIKFIYKMCYFLLFVFLLLSLANGQKFDIESSKSNLISWTNKDGIQQRLLILPLKSQLKSTFVQKQTLPYDFMVEQDCKIIQDYKQASLLERNTERNIKLEYIYSRGNQIIVKDFIQFSDTIDLKFGKEQTYQLSLKFQQNKNYSQNSLYIFNNQTLRKFDSKLFSTDSQCFMLSRMTQKLCKEQQCVTLSPFQIFDQQIGQPITDFKIVKDVIYLNDQSNMGQQNQQIQVEMAKINSDNQLQPFQYQISQSIVHLSLQNSITVEFSYDLVNASSTSNNLKTSSDSQNQYLITINMKNLQPSFCIKTLRMYNKDQLIFQNKFLFNPLQIFQYQIIWKQSQAQTPIIQLLNQNLEVQQTFNLNFNDISINTIEQSKFQNQNIYSKKNVEELTLTQSQQSIVPFFLAGGGGGLILIAIIVFLCCKKRIKSCLFTKKQNQNNPEVEQNDKKQSGREFNLNYQITFQKKQSVISQFASAETQDRTTRSNTDNDIPTVQCSINEQIENNTCQNEVTNQFKVKKSEDSEKIKNQMSQNQNIGPISFKKRQRPFHQEISLSAGTSQSQSHTKKRLRRAGKNKDIQEEQTQNV